MADDAFEFVEVLEENQRLPSGPTVNPETTLLVAGSANWVTTPAGVIRTTDAAGEPFEEGLLSAHQRFPSVPTVKSDVVA
jgi:hypothetical protein